jgi:hypothetical protein
MNYTVEMALSAHICVSSFINIASEIPNLLAGVTHIDTQNHFYFSEIRKVLWKWKTLVSIYFSQLG